MKEKATFVGQMREKEKMIEDLKSQVTDDWFFIGLFLVLQVKSSSSQPDSSRQQLEERLKELTESLIEKQTNLEELTAEYNSTQLQLKRAEVRRKGTKDLSDLYMYLFIFHRQLLLKLKLKLKQLVTDHHTLSLT